MAQFTRMALRKTLLQLLETHPLDKITVKMIVDACGVSRNTFYYHYEDIPALLRDTLATELAQFSPDNIDIRDPTQRGTQLLAYIASKPKVFERIYHSEYCDQLRAGLLTSCKAVISAGLMAGGADALDPVIQHSIITFFAEGMLSLCYQWLEAGAVEPPELLLQRLALFDGLPEAVVERAKHLDI